MNEPYSPAPVEPRWHVIARWLVMAVGTLLAGYGALWALSVVAEWMGRMR